MLKALRNQGFLFLIARKTISDDGAFVAIVFYLFLPFSICASRSFQPDSMMVMLILASLYAILRYFDHPSLLRMGIAAFASSLALIIKPLCGFYIYGVFFALSVDRINRENWKSEVIPSCVLFGFLSILPSIVYYCYGLFFAGFLQGQVGGRVLPKLLLEPFFWKGWLNMIGRVVGWATLIGGFVGLLISRGKPLKPFLLGLWGGYIAFGLVITYQMHNHDYYHLPFIPFVALSIAPVCILLLNRANKKNILILFLMFTALIGSASIYFVSRVELLSERPYIKFTSEVKNQLKMFSNFFGINPQFGSFIALSFNKEIELAKDIGERVQHSTKTILLSSAYGKPLKYHGNLSGDFWPAQAHLQYLEMSGIKTLSVEERFKQMVKENSPDFFVVSNFYHFEEQPDLIDFLYNHFPLFVEHEKYLIFDLRNTLNQY